MNHLTISVVFAILSLHPESVSCRFDEQNLSDTDQIIVQSFKKKLLKELGFSTVPNVSDFKAPKIPLIYRKLIEAENSKYRRMTEEEDDGFYAKTKRIFLFPEQVASGTDKVTKNYLFKSNSEHSNLEIKSATLWVHITEGHKSVGTQHGVYELGLYRGYKANGEDVGAKELFHLDQLNATGWHSVEVSSVVKEWFSMHLSLDLNLEIGGVATKPLQPFLAIDTDEKRHINRKRRQADFKECPSTHPNRCCLHELEIVFEEIGWDFVIVPTSINAFACIGVCESVGHYRSPSRAQAFRNLKLLQNPCCRPNKMAPFSMMFINENLEIISTTIPNMTVVSCNCAY